MSEGESPAGGMLRPRSTLGYGSLTKGCCVDFLAGVFILVIVIAVPFFFIPGFGFVFGLIGKLLKAMFGDSGGSPRVHDPEKEPTVVLTCPNCGFAAGYPPRHVNVKCPECQREFEVVS